MRRVPEPPCPSFECADPTRLRAETNVEAKPKPKMMPPLGLDFLRRAEHTAWWFGGVICIAAFVLTQSVPWTASLGAGCLLSVALLRSQIWFVTTLLSGNKVKDGKSAQRLLWALQPAKYLILMLLLGWLIKRGGLRPEWFAIGVSLAPFVIVTNALSRWVSFSQRPLSEAYGKRRNRI